MIKHNSACLLFTATEFQPKIKKENIKKINSKNMIPLLRTTKSIHFMSTVYMLAITELMLILLLSGNLLYTFY